MNKRVIKFPPKKISEVKPKFFSQIADTAILSEIFVYSTRDFHLGSTAFIRSNAWDGKEPIPYYGERNQIDLAGSYTKEAIAKSLAPYSMYEKPNITTLRDTIVTGIEAKRVFNGAVRTIEEARELGIVFLDKYIGNISVGIMAFDN